MPSSDDYIKAVVMVSLVLLLGGAMIPTALSTMNEPFQETFTQESGNAQQIKGPVYSTPTNVDDTTGDEVTFELENNETGTVTSATIQNSTSSNMTVGDVTYEVSVDDIPDSSTVVATYEAPRDAHWDGASAVMYGLLGVIALVAILLAIVRPFLDF